MSISMAFLALALFFTFRQALAQIAKKSKYFFIFNEIVHGHLSLNQSFVAPKSCYLNE
jgi:hypothetical protein